MGWAEGRGAVVGEGFAGVGPVEGMGHREVEVVQKRSQLRFEVGHGCEVAAADDLPHHNAEDGLDLIQPRTVLRQEYEADAMLRSGQEFTPRGLRLEDALFAFFPPKG